jgi:hypothetical protein
VIPVIKGVTVTISESLRQYLTNIPGRHEITEVLKTAILGTALHTDCANVKVQNIFYRHNNTTGNTNFKCRTAATLYTLVTWLVSGLKL